MLLIPGGYILINIGREVVMRCPKCDASLQMAFRHGVIGHWCSKCCSVYVTKTLIPHLCQSTRRNRAKLWHGIISSAKKKCEYACPKCHRLMGPLKIVLSPAYSCSSCLSVWLYGVFPLSVMRSAEDVAYDSSALNAGFRASFIRRMERSMGITLHPPTDPQRFRITRRWRNQEFQAYVPIGKSIEKARKQAQLLDARLAERQRAYLLRMELEGLHVLHPNGRIIGLLRQRRYRADRKPSDTFKIRLVLDGQGTVFKDYEIYAKRTFHEAFMLAVNFIAEAKNVEAGCELYEKMVAAKPLYEIENHSLENGTQRDNSCDDLFHILAAEVIAFQQRQGRRLIRG